MQGVCNFRQWMREAVSLQSPRLARVTHDLRPDETLTPAYFDKERQSALTFIFPCASFTMISSMALRTEFSGTTKLIVRLVTPSWASGLFAMLIGITTVIGTILLTRLGNSTQQSLLGLHAVYSQSSLSINVNAVGQHLGSNSFFNNAVLFVLWGSVGLVVYSIVQGLVTEFKNTDDLLREMHYVHANRQTLVHDTTIRAITRLTALAAWWTLAWILLHKVFPYAIASAHLTAYHTVDTHNWLHTLLGFCYCLLSLHGLTVLSRLIVLRPRLTGNSIVDN